MDLVQVKEKVYPIGLMDKDSSGLMILTNDGELTNKMTHPRYGNEKEYFIVLNEDLKPQHVKKLEHGMVMQGERIPGIKVVMAKNKSTRLVLKEGMSRQIRAILGRLGYSVIKFKRVRIGKLELGDLKEGQWKKIDKNLIY